MNPPITVTGAARISPLVVELTVDGVPGMVHGATYTLIVQNVADGHNNPITTQTLDFLGRGAVVAELTDTPPNPTNNPNIDATVGGTDIVSYQYRIDGGGWSAETPLSTDDTITIAGLTELPNPHVLEVVGKDSLGNWQSKSAPTVFSWQIDMTAPTVELLNKPANPTNVVTTSINVTGAGVVAYKYRLDSSESWSNIDEISGSPIVETVANGTHTLEVIGRDAAGNWQSIAPDAQSPYTYTWTVDTTKKFAEFLQKPTDPTSDTGANFKVGGDGVIEYAYRIDGGSWDGGVGYPLTGIDISDDIVITGLADGPHTVDVIGLDDAGNWQDDTTPTSWPWTVDTVAPTAKIASKPANPSNDLTPTFTIAYNDLEGDDTVKYYKYRLYKGAVLVSDWSIMNPQPTPLVLNLVDEGTYKIDFVAIDFAYNEQDHEAPTSYTWVLDTTKPMATINNPPTNPSNQTSWNFTVGGDPDMVSYQYKLDGNDWSPEILMATTTTVAVSGLTETPDPHVLYVKGKDQAGNWQTTAATFPWTVDLTAPTVDPTGVPPLLTNSTSIDVTVGGVGVVSYKYKLDGGGWSSEVTSLSTHITASGLSASSHTLQIIGKDQAGNWQSVAPDVQSPYTYTWTIDLSVPTVTFASGKPANPTNVQTTDITMASTVSYKYRIDGGSWSSETPIATHIQLSGLSETSHTIDVIGKNGAGTWQSTSSPTSWTWVIDLHAPTASLTGCPASLVNFNTTDITVGGTGGVTKYQYNIDSTGWSAVTPVATHITLSGLSSAGHTLLVRGGDDAGNWQSVAPDVQSPASCSWTVDMNPPTPPAVSDTGLTSTSTTLSFSWTNTTDFAEVSIQISTDSGFGSSGVVVYGWPSGASLSTPSPASGTQTYNYTINATNGALYYARVKVRDAAGNWSGWGPASDGIYVVGSITGTVKDTTLATISGATVTLLKGGVTVGTPVTTNPVTTNSSGVFTLSNVPIGSNAYTLQAAKSGYNNSALNNISVQAGQVTNVGIIYIVSTAATPAKILGRTVNSNDGNDVTSVTCHIYKWDGTEVANSPITTSSSDGTFTIFSSSTLPAGVYTLVFSKSGYFDLSFDGIPVDGRNGNTGDTTNSRYALCEILTEPHVRVIVQWGDSPSDLDLHVVGPTAKNNTSDGTPNNRFHVYWHGHKSWDENTGAYASGADPTGTSSTTSLVQDDTNSYGPEAINLFGYGSGYANGIYTFTVHNFSNSDWYASTTPTTMRVFDSQGLVMQMPLPTGAGSNIWYWKMIKINISGQSRNQRVITVDDTFASPNLTYSSKSSMNW
jgi:hypothetical protein